MPRKGQIKDRPALIVGSVRTCRSVVVVAVLAAGFEVDEAVAVPVLAVRAAAVGVEAVAQEIRDEAAPLRVLVVAVGPALPRVVPVAVLVVVVVAPFTVEVLPGSIGRRRVDARIGRCGAGVAAVRRLGPGAPVAAREQRREGAPGDAA